MDFENEEIITMTRSELRKMIYEETKKVADERSTGNKLSKKINEFCDEVSSRHIVRPHTYQCARTDVYSGNPEYIREAVTRCIRLILNMPKGKRIAELDFDDAQKGMKVLDVIKELYSKFND